MSHTPQITPTDMIREYLALGAPATRRQLAKALNIDIKQVINSTQGLTRKGDIEVTRSHQQGKEAIYSINENYTPKPTRASLVSTAIANQPELARVWM